MKKTISLLITLCTTLMLQAQISKTVNVTAGGLAAALTASEKSTITNLIVTGNIDARDFLTMRDLMPKLAVVDLEIARIVAYSGEEGTGGTYDQDYPANEIPEEAFYKYNKMNQSLVSIKLPNTVTRIGEKAFYKCQVLSSIQLPNSLISIGNGAMWECNSLKNIEIPNSVEEIEDWAFLDSDLETIVIPASVKKFGKNIFAQCTNLKSFEIKAPITLLEEYTFSFCINLKTAIIPSTVTTIGKYAFQSCSKMTSVYIPSSVTTIESHAFDFCLKLETISIPSSVTKIGSYAFYSCESINSVITENQVPLDLSLSSSVFAGVNSLKPCKLFVPKNSIDSYKVANQWKDFMIVEELQNLDVAYTFNKLPSEGCNNSINLTTGSSWNITSNQAWVMATPASGAGNSPISIATTTNTTSSDRTANIIFWGNNCIPKLVLITQSGLQNILTVSKNSLNIGSTPGSTTTVNVTSNTAWTATSNETWLTVNPGTSTTGNATLTLTATENTTVNPRTASITVSATGVASQTITVTQSAGDATLMVSSNNSSVGKAAGSTTAINVTSNTAWTATSNQTWLTVNPVTSTTGNATLTLTATENTTINTRTASVTISATGIASQTITITQEATLATLLVSENSVSVASNASSTASITITSNTSWTASSDQVWLTVSQTSETGDGSLVFTAEANPTSSERSAIVTISAEGVESQTILVSQAGMVGNPTVQLVSVTLFPNPITNGFSISGLEGSALLTLSDLNGKLLLSKEIYGNEYIPASLLPKGIYIVRITIDEGRIEKKLVKE